jgi:creatinine amidohydrolase/Fe(II)-dependent formamide hydrolase-like protein
VRVLVVPVGATEQHGPHLPLSTDTDIALALAGMLAETHGDLFVAPAVAFGASAEHQSFAGTISVGHRAIELFWSSSGARRPLPLTTWCCSPPTAETRKRSRV